MRAGRGWGVFEEHFTSVKRYANTKRTMELVEVERKYSALSRWPQHVTLVVEPHRDMTDELEEIQARDAAAPAPDDGYLILPPENPKVQDHARPRPRPRQGSVHAASSAMPWSFARRLARYSR